MRISGTWMGTKIHASHYVDMDQFEPGVPVTGQADQHVLDFVLMNANLTFAYALNERFELSVNLPMRWALSDAVFLDKAGKDLPQFSSIHHRDETLFGLGDVGLQARYRILTQTAEGGPRIDVTAGVSFPTGGIEPNPFQLGREGKDHQHIFFGTGTFDPKLGVEFEKTFGSTSLLAAVNWQGPVYANSEDYQGPQTLVGGLTAANGFGLTSWVFRGGAELLIEWPAKWGSEAAKNSGRTDIAPVLGVTWLANQSVSTSLIIKKPFVLDHQGSKFDVPLIVIVGAAYSFGGQ